EYLTAIEFLEGVRSVEGSGRPHEAKTVAFPAKEASGAVRAPFPRLGECTLLRELGRGGMGVVYEAEQSGLGRRVAVKVLPLHSLLDRRSLERFRREAQAAANLSHAHIVPVFGLGEERGVHYYTMQLVEGAGLDDVIQAVRRLRGWAKAGSSYDQCNQERQELAGSSAAALLARDLSPSSVALPSGAARPPSPFPRCSPECAESPPPPDAQAWARYFRNVALLGQHVASALAHA